MAAKKTPKDNGNDEDSVPEVADANKPKEDVDN